ncbi:prolyl 4-hydroxylase subunit alpha-2 [Folsomia candida]|uniref:prolyl 4-hydroxylase subunit alpha-2 n=1 Tax=Folsomia candida TaxID=158441 RepID=UPI000B8F9A22|nr:prolyl 4-hydroxylase subunit alpha-2 [Folsomia candida]
MGAVLGNVFKLQYIFDLEPEDLAVGRIGKTETGISLPFEHILEIAEAAIEFKEFTASAAWLRLAKDKKIPGHEQVWAELVRRHDEAFTDESKNLHLFEHPLATHPDAAPIKFRNLEKWKDATLAEMEADLTASHYATLALCRAGDTLRGGWKLRGCWYDYQYIKGPHGPLLPVRVEQLTDDPDGLVMFRDYIPTQWVKKLKEISLPEMPFQEPPSHWQQGEPSVAGFAWFEDVDVARDQNVWIARKLELTTGLSVVGNIASEKLRVTLYSLVGQISPHHDAYSIFSNSAEDSSLYLDRISTMLIYLNTVELGGSTVFPVAGVAVAPREGDAIFWHSRWRNGTVDKRWLHAACPIPLGVKWTASKWVKNDGNAFSRKCDINSQL